MLDPKLLRSDLPGVAAELARRGFVLDVARICGPRGAAQGGADRGRPVARRTQRQCQGGGAGEVERAGRRALLALGESLRRSLQGIETAARGDPGANWPIVQMGLPNILHASVPAGRDEADNVEVRRWGDAAQFAFEPKDHVAIGERLGMDFEAAGRISGARFVVMTGASGEAAPRSHPVHARLARARARLSRGLRAVSRARRGAAGHRAAAEVRAGSVRGARRSGLLLDSDRRSAGDESGARSDSRRRLRCR